MILSRNQFFLLLLVLLVGPFYFYKILWLHGSNRTKGLVGFMGHTLELDGSISRHIVILFKAGEDSVSFNAADNLGYHPGDSVQIRYQKDQPSDARIDEPSRIWGDTWVNSLSILLILLVLFFTPARFDPLIPKKAKILLGKKPFIKIIPYGSNSYK
jgi:hypothetical protein